MCTKSKKNSSTVTTLTYVLSRVGMGIPKFTKTECGCRYCPTYGILVRIRYPHVPHLAVPLSRNRHPSSDVRYLIPVNLECRPEVHEMLIVISLRLSINNYFYIVSFFVSFASRIAAGGIFS